MRKSIVHPGGFVLGVLIAAPPLIVRADAPQKLNTLIVDGAAKSNRKLSEHSQYLVGVFDAMNRTAEMDRRQGLRRYPVKTATALTPSELKTQRVVLLCSIAKITQEQAAAIENFVREGGLLLIFPGDGFDRGSWNKYLFKEGKGLLSSEFDSVSKLKMVSLDSRESKLRVLRAPEFTSIMKAVTVSRASKLAMPKAGDNAKSLLKLSNGDAAILQKPFGKGRCVQFAFSTSPEWTPITRLAFVFPVLIPLIVEDGIGNEQRKN